MPKDIYLFIYIYTCVYCTLKLKCIIRKDIISYSNILSVQGGFTLCYKLFPGISEDY